MVEKRQRLSQLKTVMTRLPQVLLNVIVKEKKDFAQMPKVRQDREVEPRWPAAAACWSATPEPRLLARVMLEGEDEKKIRAMAQDMADEIRAEVGE